MRFQVLVSATGPAARVQWDRMGQFHTDADADANMPPILTGLYYATGQTLHGRQGNQESKDARQPLERQAMYQRGLATIVQPIGK